MNDSRDQNVDLPEGTKREKGTKFNTKSKNLALKCRCTLLHSI